MQKYYHKGAYYMDKAADGSEELYNRDFNEALAIGEPGFLLKACCCSFPTLEEIYSVTFG